MNRVVAATVWSFVRLPLPLAVGVLAGVLAGGTAVAVVQDRNGSTGRPSPPVTSPTGQSVPLPPLGPGSTGADVRALQDRLHDLAYQVETVTGTYDDETAHSVTAFQKLHGLPPTGVADAATRERLGTPIVPVSQRPTVPRRVEVDLARQVVLLVEHGQVVRIYDTSTGAPGSPTPEGDFQVQYKIDGWRYARLGPLWRPVYFTFDGIALHGGEPVVPTPASHGCVRLTDASMDRLFALLAPGTPVSLY